MDLQGGVKATNGTVSINNDFGDMYVSSNVEVSKGNLGIINRANGADMTLAQAGNVNVKGGNINIKNYGKKDLTTVEKTMQEAAEEANAGKRAEGGNGWQH